MKSSRQPQVYDECRALPLSFACGANRAAMGLDNPARERQSDAQPRLIPGWPADYGNRLQHTQQARRSLSRQQNCEPQA
jgi:hypothetical protein